MLVAGRYLLSIAWPNPPDDRYYWEHCFYVDTDDFDNSAQMFLAVQADMKLLYTNQVNLDGVTFYVPNTTTIHYRQNSGPSNPGNLSSVGEFTILVAARWRMLGPLGERSYHLHRQPVGLSYLDGEDWSSTGRTQSQSRINTFIAQGIYRASNGALLESGVLAHKPAYWQMRHGTKRRQKRFWLP